jgi:hypothetical protein
METCVCGGTVITLRPHSPRRGEYIGTHFTRQPAAAIPAPGAPQLWRRGSEVGEEGVA